MICEVKAENYLENFLESDGMSISMSHLECSYVMSRPTGQLNLALSDKVRGNSTGIPKLNIDLSNKKNKMNNTVRPSIADLESQKGTGYNGGSALRTKNIPGSPKNTEPKMFGPQLPGIQESYMDGYAAESELTIMGQAIGKEDYPMSTITGEPQFEETKVSLPSILRLYTVLLNFYRIGLIRSMTSMRADKHKDRGREAPLPTTISLPAP